MIKLNIHSIVDVITNSSTVIYTWQNSVKEAKDLLQEILAMTGTEKSVDDLFFFGVFLEDNDYYADRLSDSTEDEIEDFPQDWPKDYEQQDEYLESLKERIMKGEVNKPKWMDEFEEGNGYGFAPSSSLHIIPKDQSYAKIVEKMIAFLNSPNCDGEYDG